MSLSFNQPVECLKGVGKKLTEAMARLDICTLQDMLFHLPTRYSDRTKITAISQLELQQLCVIEGEITHTQIQFGKRRSLACRLEDGTGSILLRFYHFSAAQKNQLTGAQRIRCYGEIRRGNSGFELYHPEYVIESTRKPMPPLEQTLTPVYSVTEGLGQTRLRDLIAQAFERVDQTDLPVLLPSQEYTSLLNILCFLHNPPADARTDQLLAGDHPMQQLLVLEELVAYQLSLLRLRAQRRALNAPVLSLVKSSGLNQQFVEALAFELTGAQQNVSLDIASDLGRSIPMMRLIQGDVGSGKTVVAALAALQAVANGQQVAIMAPTDILASQHKRSFEEWFEPLGIKVGFLSGKQKAADKRENTEKVEQGVSQIVVGTHALFQDAIEFAALGLVIIDEQHRFGVHQRMTLRAKGQDDSIVPHLLIMTATPIPRTLAMSAYADLDYSVIDQLPAGRKPITTVLIGHARRDSVVERINLACLEGRQAYWVCTLIEESETLSAQAAEVSAEYLQKELPELRVGLLHGRLKPADKQSIMEAFKAGELDLLVATTVIEVGVDVPNASLMVIENPERLGLAQLHQLRGRVGRGTEQSHCVLLYGDPLSKLARARLEAMRSTRDGFQIAEIDMELRGPGEVLGTRQTGDISFKLADLSRDQDLLPKARSMAEELIGESSDKIEPLVWRWLGHSERFGLV
ncbi:ATP-dependent DNA helicase RecG [bacterium]|nr:ATP-dependent DNA helicase RecG [bacterium]